MAGDVSVQPWASAFTISRVGAYAVELQDVFDRILTLSTAALALIATFAQKFSGGSVWIGVISLIAFTVTIVSCLSVRAAVATWKLAYVNTDGPPVPPRISSRIEREQVEAIRQSPTHDPARLEAYEAELSRLEAYEAAVEARHQLSGVMLSKLTRWLVMSMTFAVLAFVIALGFLTAFGASALS
jgi:hypothetical protein